jgi:hypothetical protein
MEVMTIREYLVQKMEKREIANAKRRAKALEKRLQQNEVLYLELKRKTEEIVLEKREAEKQQREAKKQQREAEKQQREAEKQQREAEKREQKAENLLIKEEQKRQLAEAAAAKNRLKLVNTAKQLAQHDFSLEAIAQILSETTESVQAMLDEK